MNADALQTYIYTQTPQSNDIVRLSEAFRRHGSQVSVGMFENDREWSLLRSCDILVVRASPRSYLQAMRVADEYSKFRPEGVVSVTRHGIELSFDKFKAYHALLDADIPTPESWLITSQEDLRRYGLSDILPLVVKPLNENRGIGVYVVFTENQLYTATAENLTLYGSCLAQRFVENTAGKDIRILVSGGSVIAAMERSAPAGKNVANLARGGKALPTVISPEEEELAISATPLFECHFAGVDILRSPQGPVILEVNVSPGLKISDITNIDAAGLIAQNLIRERNTL